MISSQPTKTLGQKGFTIIELLIATSVLTVILLLVTVMISNIGTLYYKAIALSQTQGTTREITYTVTQDIKLSDNGADTGIYSSGFGGGVIIKSYCIGTVRYSYITGRQIGDDPTAPAYQIPHILWRDSRVGVNCDPVDLTDPGAVSASEGTELMAPRTRLTEFSIDSSLLPSPNPTLKIVKVGVAYGAEDLLSGTGPGAYCVGGSGNQFCAVDSLKTTVVQRLIAGD